MKLILMGYGEGIELIADVLKDEDILGLVLPANRDRTQHTIEFCKKNEIPLLMVEELKDLSFDYIISASYTLILKRDILDIPTMGCLNLHGSLLPAYAGNHSYLRQLEAGERINGDRLEEVFTKRQGFSIPFQLFQPSKVRP